MTGSTRSSYCTKSINDIGFKNLIKTKERMTMTEVDTNKAIKPLRIYDCHCLFSRVESSKSLDENRKKKTKKTKIDSLKSIVRWNVKIEYKSNLQCIFQALHLYNITILEITIVSWEKYYLIMMILSLPNASGSMFLKNEILMNSSFFTVIAVVVAVVRFLCVNFSYFHLWNNETNSMFIYFMLA